MRLLVSGATKTIRRLLSSSSTEELARAHLGHLLTPANGNRIETLLDTGLPIAVDNNAFAYYTRGQDFDWHLFCNFVEQLLVVWKRDQRLRDALQWITAPDVVANWFGTFKAWRTWDIIRPAGAEQLPWAYVWQDGQTASRLPYEGDPRASSWTGIRCAFIGGSDDPITGKLSSDAAAFVVAAKRQRRLVHVGRVNSFKRLDAFDGLGVDSFDGGQFSRHPDEYVRPYLERLTHRQERLI